MAAENAQDPQSSGVPPSGTPGNAPKRPSTSKRKARGQTLEFNFPGIGIRLPTASGAKGATRPKRKLIRKRDQAASTTVEPQPETNESSAVEQPAESIETSVEAPVEMPTEPKTPQADVQPTPEVEAATVVLETPEPVETSQPETVVPENISADSPHPAESASPESTPEPEPQDTTMKPPSPTEYQSRSRNNTGGWMGLSNQTTKPRSPKTEDKARGVNDFRQNAARQAKEQKAMGNVLGWVAYTIAGGLLLVTVLAAMGGYMLLQMIESQAVTVSQLDHKYESLVADIRAEMDLRNQELAVELAEARGVAERQAESMAVLSGQLESTQQELINTQGELAEMQKLFKAEAGRRYRGDINNNAKINRAISRIRKLERR